MYKITFKNPEDETKRIQKTLSEFEAKKAMKAKKDRSVYSIPGFGMVGSGMIISITKQYKKQKQLSYPKTRYEKEKPTKEEWQALTIGFVYTHPYKIIFNATPSFLQNIVKSLWNLNNDRTKECLEIGREWTKEGKTFKDLMYKIQQT